ncbi:uncharacterized protein LOC110216809 [Phascolarctos cinereus]
MIYLGLDIKQHFFITLSMKRHRLTKKIKMVDTGSASDCSLPRWLFLVPTRPQHPDLQRQQQQLQILIKTTNSPSFNKQLCGVPLPRAYLSGFASFLPLLLLPVSAAGSDLWNHHTSPPSCRRAAAAAAVAAPASAAAASASASRCSLFPPRAPRPPARSPAAAAATPSPSTFPPPPLLLRHRPLRLPRRRLLVVVAAAAATAASSSSSPPSFSLKANKHHGGGRRPQPARARTAAPAPNIPAAHWPPALDATIWGPARGATQQTPRLPPLPPQRAAVELACPVCSLPLFSYPIFSHSFLFLFFSSPFSLLFSRSPLVYLSLLFLSSHLSSTLFPLPILSSVLSSFIPSHPLASFPAPLLMCSRKSRNQET